MSIRNTIYKRPQDSKYSKSDHSSNISNSIVNIAICSCCFCVSGRKVTKVNDYMKKVTKLLVIMMKKLKVCLNMKKRIATQRLVIRLLVETKSTSCNTHLLRKISLTTYLCWKLLPHLGLLQLEAKVLCLAMLTYHLIV